MTVTEASEHIAVGCIKVQSAVRSEALPASYGDLASVSRAIGVHLAAVDAACAGTCDAIATTSHGAVDAAVSLATYLAMRAAAGPRVTRSSR